MPLWSLEIATYVHCLSSDTEDGVPYHVIVVAVNEEGSGEEDPLLHFFGELRKFLMRCPLTCPLASVSAP